MPQPTNLSEAELRAIAERALPNWGIKAGRLEFISNAENCTFRLVEPTGRAHSLRVHRPGYHTLAELESELIWTQALNDAGIRVPVGRRTLSGDSHATIPTPDGKSSRAVGLVDWVEGPILGRKIAHESDLKRIAASFEQIGRIAGRIHNQSSGWKPPPGFTRHAFDMPGYVGDAPYWGRFWEVPSARPEQKEIMIRARDRIAKILGDYGQSPDTFSMIHADLHPKNIVIAESGALHVIDFDDAGFGWHQFELAVALYDVEDEPFFHELTHALITGYRSERPISDEALSLIPLFLLIRLLMSIGWTWERPDLGRQQAIPGMVEEACARVVALGF